MVAVVGRNKLTWKGRKLYFQRQLMASVVQDAKYPTMFRIQLPGDANLSDMVNLTRAKDAAESMALANLNR